jgi:hypothetical protein
VPPAALQEVLGDRFDRRNGADEIRLGPVEFHFQVAAANARPMPEDAPVITTVKCSELLMGCLR